MSISSIGSVIAPSYTATGSSGSSSGAVRKDSAPSAAASDSSSTVTLSADALALAKLNSEGVTVALIPGPGLSSGFQPASMGIGTGAVSEAGFEAVANQFGATKSQADRLFGAMDTNGNGSISNGELLGALGNVGNGSSPASKQLLSLMDTNGDRSVSGTEMLNFESAVVEAEKAS